MKRYLYTLLLWSLPLLMFAQDNATLSPDDSPEQVESLTMDERINSAIAPVTDFVSRVIFYKIPFSFAHLKISPDMSYLDLKDAFRVQFNYELVFENEILDESLSISDYSSKSDTLKKMSVWGNASVGNVLDFLSTEYHANAILRAIPGQGMEKSKELDSGATLTMAVPFVLIWLIFAAVFFTLFTRFINIRKFGLAIDIVRGKYTDPNESGEVSHFQALTAALSGTVGLGNIAGVAIAIATGGPGATFWMILAGFLGMSSKFMECTLGVKYRQIDENGVVHGGPMYYLSEGLKKKGMGGLGKFFAGFFAVMCIGGSFGGGNMFQINQAYDQFNNVFGAFVSPPAWVFGIIVALFVGVVIIGGIKSIANVTDKIVPFMCGIYVVCALIILGVNYQHVPDAFSAIFRGAFDADALYGGIIGVLIIGFQRAAFSNEAGIGSASIAHSAVKTENPASEGIVALLEPFIDTIVVCTMTALVIVITGVYEDSSASGVTLTSRSFSTVISWFPYLLAVAVMLFAFSTMISWSYYGLQSWTYLFGKSKISDVSYKVLFCVFVVIGATMTLDKVTDFSDAMIFAMCFPNVIGLYILAPEVRAELNKYLEKIRSGEIIRQD